MNICKRPHDLAANPKLLLFLTVRQCEVLQMIAEGKSTKQIAFELKLKPETITVHLSAIRQKLGAKTNAHAVYVAHFPVANGAHADCEPKEF